MEKMTRERLIECRDSLREHGIEPEPPFIAAMSDDEIVAWDVELYTLAIEAVDKPRPTSEEMRAAMRRALAEALDGVSLSNEAWNAIDEAVDRFDDELTHVLENPCGCPAGRTCGYRAEPPSNPDVDHCEQCGAWMPGDPSLVPSDDITCPDCGTEFVVGEPEDV